VPGQILTAALSGRRDFSHSSLDSATKAQYALEEAGYSVRFLQGSKYDAIPQGEALLGVLRDSDLVALDFSANPETAELHHGLAIEVGRARESTLVLSPRRQPQPGDTPFTTIVFGGHRELGKKLRRFFGISEPVHHHTVGRQFSFDAEPAVFGLSDVFVARAVLAALRALRFCGRAEGYSSLTRFFTPPRYLFALAVRPKTSKRQPTVAWWRKLQAEIASATALQNAGVVLTERFCRCADVSHFREEFRHEGVVEFSDGLPVRVLNPRRASLSFELAALSSLGHELPAMSGQSIPRPASDLW